MDIPKTTTMTTDEQTTIAQGANKFKISAKNINVGRLRDASDQCEKVLVRNLQAPFVQYLRKAYEKGAMANKRGGRFADLIAFQQFLLEVAKWNSVQVESVAKEIIGAGAFRFYETIKFLLVAKVFLMASVRSFEGDENSALSMPMPTLSDYIHRVLFLIARELFVSPSLIRIQADSYELEVANNHQQLNALVERAIKDAIIDLVPHDHIMDTYLSETLKGVSFELPPQPAPIVVPEPVVAATQPTAAIDAASILAPSPPVQPITPVKLADIVALHDEHQKPIKSKSDTDASDSDAVELSDSDDSESESDSSSSSSSSSSDDDDDKHHKKHKKVMKKKHEKDDDKKKTKKKVRHVKVPKEEKQ